MEMWKTNRKMEKIKWKCDGF